MTWKQEQKQRASPSKKCECGLKPGDESESGEGIGLGFIVKTYLRADCQTRQSECRQRGEVIEDDFQVSGLKIDDIALS